MDFTVAAIRCFDCIKVHHDKRWLRQQRMLCISTRQILTCNFPATGTPAHDLFLVFSAANNNENNNNNNSSATSAASSSSSSKPAPSYDSTQSLQERYAKACSVLKKEHVTFEDIKAVFLPNKTHNISDISGVQLKGTDHLCINYRSDHTYYFNTPLAITISRIVRTRFVAYSSAKLVEGNLESSSSSASSAPNSPNATSGSGGKQAPQLHLKEDCNPDVGFSRISDLFQAGVIELPANSDVDHLQPAAMELTRALDWYGGASPASSLAEVSSSIQKLAADAENWKVTIIDNNELSTAIATATATATAAASSSSSSTTKLRTRSKITVGKSEKASEFRHRFDTLRNLLVENYLYAETTSVKELEASFGEKLTFWRSKHKLPQFEDVSDAELVAELALQNLIFRNPSVFHNLWKDVESAYSEEVSLFKQNCRLLASPSVPFSYFGIPRDFETVRFDLVKHHLRSLRTCKTPSAMLNAVVSAIKSVIVCVKARHVLSTRWSRACSEFSLGSGASSGGGAGSSGSSGNDNNNNNNNTIPAAAVAVAAVSAAVQQEEKQQQQEEEEAESTKKHHKDASLSPSPSTSSIMSSPTSSGMGETAPSVSFFSDPFAAGGENNNNQNDNNNNVPKAAVTTTTSAEVRDQRSDTLTSVTSASSAGPTASEAKLSSLNKFPSPSSATGSLSPLLNSSASFWTKQELEDISAEAKKHSIYNTDDVLPVFIYIVAFCDMPDLVLYNRFLEKLSYDGEASERSFYVTVFYSAIEWLLDWKKPTTTKKEKEKEGEEAEKSSSSMPRPTPEPSPSSSHHNTGSSTSSLTSSTSSSSSSLSGMSSLSDNDDDDDPLAEGWEKDANSTSSMTRQHSPFSSM